jgi:hypothetical protein
MQMLPLLLQVIIALGLFNVWLVRFSRPTPYRGGAATTMMDEFAAYGLPVWSVYAVGALKVWAGLALLLGIWFPSLVLPAASLVAALMLGALIMHLKIGDPGGKSVPALVMLVLSVTLVWLSAR